MLLISLHPFYDEKYNTTVKDRDTVYWVRIEELVGKHKSQIAPSLRYAFGTEDDPADDGEEEGEGYLQCLLDVGKVAAVGYHMLVFCVDVEKVVNG